MRTVRQRFKLLQSLPFKREFSRRREYLYSFFVRRSPRNLSVSGFVHSKLSAVTLWQVEFSLSLPLPLSLSHFRVTYCPAIDFMAGVTNIFRIKFRPAALAARVPRTWTFLPVEREESTEMEQRREICTPFQSRSRSTPPINPRVLSS